MSREKEWPWSAFTIAEFCQHYRISRSTLYREWENKTGPRIKQAGQHKIITVQAAKEWAGDAMSADARVAALERRVADLSARLAERDGLAVIDGDDVAGVSPAGVE